MTDKQTSRELAVLQVLRERDAAMTSADLTLELSGQGLDISERTVRLCLSGLDDKGFTKNLGKRGRIITKEGIAEIYSQRTLQRMGFLSAKIDQMTYRMSFDLALRTGTVVVNTSLLERRQLVQFLGEVCKVFEKRLAMGYLCGLLAPGERMGDILVPEGMVGFCTVCSITLNGVLLKHGIPCRSRFGGLMELQNLKPQRFLELIDYDGTTIDPLEIFIRSGMTNYLGAISTGAGRVGASFRELPSDSRDLAMELGRKLDAVGLGGFVEIGSPGQPLFGIPVSEGRCGAVIIGGLNPMAVFEEMGVSLFSRALSGLLEFQRLFRYEELAQRVRSL